MDQVVLVVLWVAGFCCLGMSQRARHGRVSSGLTVGLVLIVLGAVWAGVLL